MLRPSAGETLRAWLLSALVVHGAVAGNPDAKRLYDDLLSNYNKLVRPVVNTSDVLRVCIKLKLSQLIDVLFSKCGNSSAFSQQCDIGRKIELDSTSHLSVSLKPGSEETEYNESTLRHSVPYDRHDGSSAVMSSNFLPNNLEENLKASLLEKKKKRKSKTISNCSEEDTTKGKNSYSPSYVLNPGKSRKVNRSEGLSKKFKYLDSASERKKILENCGIIRQEVLDKSADPRKPAPVYFVVKLVEDPENEFLRLRKSHSSQSFQIIFPKDDIENGEGKELEPDDSSTFVKMKDKFNQTSDVKDKCTGVNSSEIVGSSFEEEKKSEDVKSCPGFLKVNDCIRFQREFNASLLVQVENMVRQLTVLIALLHELLKSKNEGDLINDRILQNFWKAKESSGSFAKDPGSEALSAPVWDGVKRVDSKYVNVGRVDGCREITPSDQYQISGKDNSKAAAGGKTKSTFQLRRDVAEKNERLQKKPESDGPPSQKKNKSEKKRNIAEQAKKSGINDLNKKFLEKNKNGNKCPAEEGDEKIANKNFKEVEDADYGDGGDEKESGYNKMKIQIKGEAELTNGADVCKNQVRPVVEDGKWVSNGNDVSLRPNEDKPVDLRSPSPSRSALMSSERPQTKEPKPEKATRKKRGIFHRLFSKKKN